jgi:hypothetical protein
MFSFFSLEYAPGTANSTAPLPDVTSTPFKIFGKPSRCTVARETDRRLFHTEDAYLAQEAGRLPPSLIVPEAKAKALSA